MAAPVLELRDGRTLTVVEDELVEIRAASGRLELRIRLTDDGPVLEMDAVALKLRASDSVDVECRGFSVTAQDDVRIQGQTIWLN